MIWCWLELGGLHWKFRFTKVLESAQGSPLALWRFVTTKRACSLEFVASECPCSVKRLVLAAESSRALECLCGFFDLRCLCW